MKNDNRTLHIELIRITEEKIRRFLDSLEYQIAQNQKIISLKQKSAPGIPSEEYVARSLTLKTELLKLLEELDELKRASENATKTELDVAASLMSIQSRFFDVMKRLDELIRE